MRRYINCKERIVALRNEKGSYNRYKLFINL